MYPSLLPVRKRHGQLLAATSTPGPTVSRLFFITDRASGTRYLVDTGAEVSVIPPSRIVRRSRRDGLTLQAVNGSSIANFGTQSLTLNLGLRRTFCWIFVLADVGLIIGADFLRHFGLLVDMKPSQHSHPTSGRKYCHMRVVTSPSS